MPDPTSVLSEPAVLHQGFRRAAAGTQWLIYESTDRWARVVHRFAPEFFPRGMPLVVHSLGPITSDLPRQIRQPSGPGSVRRIVLWQVDRGNFALALAAIAATHLYHTGDLQIAAVRNLSGTSQMALLETGVVTLLRHPEQFPRLRHLARAHFVLSHFHRPTTSHQRDQSSA